MTKSYHLPNIYTLLKQACSDETLRRYSYDLLNLQPVYERLAATTGKVELVERLVAAAIQSDGLDMLLEALRHDFPEAYQTHQPYQATPPEALDPVETPSPRPKNNPFTYGNAISDPGRFIGRLREIEQIQSRLLNAEFESSAIVGERRTGKTSLLKYLAHPTVVVQAGFPPDEYIFVYIDLQMFGPNHVPTDFWRRVLRQTRRFIQNAFLQQLVDEISKEQIIDTFLLDDFFSEVDNQNLHIVLLLDEFERVTQNKGFDVDFFSGLRAMAIHHNLALITSSRRELIDLTHSKAVQDSPFFNIFANVNLRPLLSEEVRTLIKTYLADQSITFQEAEIDLILELAGPHPYFVQMACYLLYETYVEGDDQAMRRRHLEGELRQEAAPMLSIYWHYSSADQRVLLAVMTLRALARGRQANKGDTLPLLKHFFRGAERTLLSLEKRSLVLDTEADPGHYRLFAWIFGEWIADELLARTGDAALWSAWQRDHSDQLNKLLPDARRRLTTLLPRLNAALADTLGEWLLNPRTVDQSLNLLEDFLRHSKQPVSPAVSTAEVNASPGGSIPPRLHMQYLARELANYNRNLDRYRMRAAQHDPADLPADLQRRIEETEAKIAEIEAQLRALGEE